MKTIQVIYENGVFRPTEPVNLPEGSEATVELRTAGSDQPQPSDPQFAHLEPGWAKIYAILSERYDSGQTDVAERHNEHQP
jgi:predicted DNA-binding antitoxin AbrB/MazE fold protein